MRSQIIHRVTVPALLCSAFIQFVSSAPQQEILRREISRTSEKEVAISLDASFGTLTIKKGSRDKIVAAEFSRPEDDKRELEMSYDISNGKGNLDISLSEDGNRRGRHTGSISWEELKGERGNIEDRELTAAFTDAIPLALKIGVGAGKGDIDLTGLMIKNLKVSAGASSAELRCEEPNEISCDNVTIESGVSKFIARHLLNLNFRKLKFSGGVGSYTLDFGGKLRQKAYAEVEVGLGAITVYVPKDVPTRIITDDGWFSSVDVDDCYEKTRKSTYENDSFERSDTSLTIKVGSGLGSIKVRCR
jgi:hypothetical protein